MRLGVDFDNTLVCYDGVFHAAAVEQGLLPASGKPLTKEALRDRLRAEGREDDWTRLQGHIYGPAMAKAKPFPGALEFLTLCRERKIPVFVISHRTRQPYLGPPHDLFAAARAWLKAQGFQRAVAPERIFFEPSKQEKLSRIASEACSHFVDDLPEFLAEPKFPERVERILFDPAEAHPDERRFVRTRSWKDLESRLFSTRAP